MQIIYIHPGKTTDHCLTLSALRRQRDSILHWPQAQQWPPGVKDREQNEQWRSQGTLTGTGMDYRLSMPVTPQKQRNFKIHQIRIISCVSVFSLFKYSFMLFERQRDGLKKKTAEITHAPWSAFQMPAASRVGAGPSQALRTQSRSFTWVTGNQILESSPKVPQTPGHSLGCSWNRKWSQESNPATQNPCI